MMVPRRPSWIRQVAWLAAWDVRSMLRERGTAIWVFVMPIVFFAFLGVMSSTFRARSATEELPLTLVAPTEGRAARAVEARLERAGYDVQRVTTRAEAADAARHVELPADFEQAMVRGDAVTLLYGGQADSLRRGWEDLRIKGALYGMIVDAIIGDDVVPSVPSSLRVVARPIGRRASIPEGFEQTIPGSLVMFVLLVQLTASARLFVLERERGVLRRLTAAPIRPGVMVLGKGMGKLALCVAQVAVAMAVATWGFGMRWGPDLGMVAVVLAAWMVVCVAASLALGFTVRSAGQATSLGLLLSTSTAAFGGCWWPIETTPPWMQDAQRFIPTGWAMNALHELIAFEAGAMAAGPSVGLLLALAVVLTAYASWRAQDR